MQLVGSGFRQLRQWSATALKEVRARASSPRQPCYALSCRGCCASVAAAPERPLRSPHIHTTGFRPLAGSPTGTSHCGHLCA